MIFIADLEEKQDVHEALTIVFQTQFNFIDVVLEFDEESAEENDTALTNTLSFHEANVSVL